MVKKCRNCGSEDMSPIITVIVVFNKKLSRGSYPLIPAEEYFICFSCGADIRLINKACDAHPVVRESGKWEHAVMVFDTGEVRTVKNTEPTFVLQA